MFETRNQEKEMKMSFSPTVLERARATAHEILSHPEVTELRFSVGDDGKGPALLLTLVKRTDVLTKFTIEDKTFYVVLPDSTHDETT